MFPYLVLFSIFFLIKSIYIYIYTLMWLEFCFLRWDHWLKIWFILLHLHCGEHPDRLYHRLVWKQHRWQPQGSAKGRANCPPHCWRWASLPPGSTPGGVQGKPGGSSRLQPPVPQSALSVALRDVSAASDPALADWGTAFSLRLSG